MLFSIKSYSIGQIDYVKIDNISKNVKANTLDSLSYKLTHNLTSEEEKVRAIFRWITNNISYDIQGFYNKNIYKEIEKKLVDSDSKNYEFNYNKLVVEKVFKERKAICDGYSRLFKYLCELSKIKTEIINGYGRIITDTIGVTGQINHSWNAVKIDKKWFLLDATWASGHTNISFTKYYKKYNNLYYLTSPEIFIKNHLPENQKWTLLNRTIQLDSFYNAPIFYDDYFKFNIKKSSPEFGVLTLDSTKRIKFEIEVDNADSSLVVIENYFDNKTKTRKDNFKYLPSVTNLINKCNSEYKIDGNKITLNYKVQKSTTDILYLFYKGEYIIKYRLKNEN